MKTIVFFTLIFFLTGCFKPEKADLVVYNAKIHTLDEVNNVYQAMAIRDGKIIEFGPERQILNKYRSKSDYDAKGKDIYPGFIDAHTHLILYAQQKLSADLSDVKSIEKLLITLEKYQDRNDYNFIIGRGLKIRSEEEFMNYYTALTKKFPEIPVFLVTHDAHSFVFNQKALEYLQNKNKKLPTPTLSDLQTEGALIDFFSFFPEFPKKKIKEELFEIQEELLQYGIIAVNEMGWSQKDYQLFKEIVKDKEWKIQISAYLLPSDENLKLLEKGRINQGKIQIQGLKLFLDGTFGSMSAALSDTYTNGTSGTLIYTDQENQLDSLLLFAYNRELQVAAHAIGDRAALQFLSHIEELDLDVRNLSWRIEHLQKITPEILEKIAHTNIIPSIQPYHAYSDMKWIQNILTTNSNFYAYRSLLNANNMIAIGSDLPIETYNPFEIMSIANQNPLSGKESISMEELMRAYTLYNAQIMGLESIIGTLQIGKEATFFSTQFDILQTNQLVNNYAIRTFIKGKETYAIE